MQHIPHNYSDEEVLRVVENTPALAEIPLVRELCERFKRVELLDDFLELADDLLKHLEEHTQGDLSAFLKRLNELKLRADELRR